METTKNQLDPFAKNFFIKLHNYLDTKIYYYGSVQRSDYFPKSSDIDVDIFTDNEQSTISKIQNFVGVEKKEFKKFVYKLHKTNKIVYGYKVKYNDEAHSFSTEIAIYNEKDKKEVLEEHVSKIDLPYHVSCLLYILKFLYYKVQILPKPVYYYFKKLFMNYFVEGQDVEYILIN
jgi:hypothetical protein